MRISTMTASVFAVGLAACGSPETSEPAADTTAEAPPSREAAATLRMADGVEAGTVIATEDVDGIRLLVSVAGLPPGARGVHVHTTGLCEGPAFESAGGHWNPANRRHGLEALEGHHAGDMPNLTVGADGSGTLDYTLRGGGFDLLLDADGSAFVVHADPDDQLTDPSGNSGERIACGVFSEQRPAP